MKTKGRGMGRRGGTKNATLGNWGFNQKLRGGEPRKRGSLVEKDDLFLHFGFLESRGKT